VVIWHELSSNQWFDRLKPYLAWGQYRSQSQYVRKGFVISKLFYRPFKPSDFLLPRAKLQESPANAKGSAQQPWYIVRKSPNRPPFRIAQQYQRNVYIVEKYFQGATIPSLTLWVYLHSFSRCSRSNMPTSAKFRENLNVQQFNLIQGR